MDTEIVVPFLKRIGVNDLPDHPLERLRILHRSMSMTVPYENLEILEGRGISLDAGALHEKVVSRRRGGYCYELNGVFAHVLEALGYRVERRLARVWATGHPAPPLTHMILRVTVEDRVYLCDVGFGVGTLREPVPWVLDASVRQEIDTFRLVATDNEETMLQGWVAERWKDLFSIIPCGVRVQDYIPANHYSSTHPDTFFTHAPMAALNRPCGRVTLRGRVFRIYGAGGMTERVLEDVDALLSVLATEFGLVGLDEGALRPRLAPLFLP